MTSADAYTIRCVTGTLSVSPTPSYPTTMGSDPDQSPLLASSTVRYYLSILCLGWYTIHWFIQLVGVYAGSVPFFHHHHEMNPTC